MRRTSGNALGQVVLEAYNSEQNLTGESQNRIVVQEPLQVMLVVSDKFGKTFWGSKIPLHHVVVADD
jgi:hypothetical protein